ncbi:MAG: hypothetical protein U0800_11285 [Isosphaeraceae bacterium]
MHARDLGYVGGSVLVLLAGSLLRSASGEAMPSRYTIVDLGHPQISDPYPMPYLGVDGTPIPSSQRPTGDYSIGIRRDGAIDPNYLIMSGGEYVVTKVGSSANLLPNSLRSTTDVYIRGLNPSGDVVGYYAGGRGAFVYSTGTNRLIDLKPLAGFTGAPGASDINKLGQIIGGQAGHAILYPTATSEPIDLNSVLTPGQDWNLVAGLAINDRGQLLVIAGKPDPLNLDPHPDGRAYGEILMTPVVAPEPTPLVLMGTAGLLAFASRAVRKTPGSGRGESRSGLM